MYKISIKQKVRAISLALGIAITVIDLLALEFARGQSVDPLDSVAWAAVLPTDRD